MITFQTHAFHVLMHLWSFFCFEYCCCRRRRRRSFNLACAYECFPREVFFLLFAVSKRWCSSIYGSNALIWRKNYANVAYFVRSMVFLPGFVYTCDWIAQPYMDRGFGVSATQNIVLPKSHRWHKMQWSAFFVWVPSIHGVVHFFWCFFLLHYILDVESVNRFFWVLFFFTAWFFIFVWNAWAALVRFRNVEFFILFSLHFAHKVKQNTHSGVRIHYVLLRNMHNCSGGPTTRSQFLPILPES